MAHHTLTIHPLILRSARVAGVRDITPRMRRITLRGEELGTFSRDGIEFPAFTSPGFDDHVKLIFASDGDVAGVLPTQLAGGIEWAPSETRQGRDYTPRRCDPEARELDLDFVLHGDGPAASWAQGATVGDELWFAGPKSSTVLPDGVDWVLLAGDETALPAIARFLEERPVEAPVRAIITVTDERARQDLPIRPSDRIEWVLAGSGDRRALADAVARLAAPAGVPYVWAAAESRALLPVRKLARTLGAPKTHVNITGYWHAEAEREAPSPRATARALPEPPVMWFALRAALDCGVLDALAAEPISVATLAHRVELPETQLEPLLELLAHGGIAARFDDRRWGLDRLGEELCEDEHAQEHYTGVEAEQVLALAALPAALRGTDSAWELTHGATFRDTVERDSEFFAELVEQAGGLPHVLSGFGRRPIWTGAKRVVITGPGAIELAEVAHEATAARLTIQEAAGPLEVLRAAATQHDWQFATDLSDAQDVAVTALALGHRTDAEAVALLRSLGAAAPRALLVERLTPDGLSPAASASQALVDFGVLGVPTRSPEATLGLIADAGWTVVERQKLGWGIESVEVTLTEPAP